MHYVLQSAKQTGMAMAKPLTHDYLLRVLRYDPDTGSFFWRVDIPKRIKAGMPAGSVDTKGKKQVGINGVTYFCHRLAWFYVNGNWPDGNVIAVNGDFADCRISNLRQETISETTRRSSAKFNSASGVKGVSWSMRRKKWIASINLNYRQVQLGAFDTIEQAKAAYEQAKSSELPPLDPNELQRKRKSVALVARQRRVYKQAFDDNGNCGWNSFADFVRDIGEPPADGSVITPVDASRPLGPSNFCWSPRARYDKKTREGRRAYSREHRSANYARYRAAGLRKSFGMELHEYEALHSDQNGLCAICGQPETHTRGGMPINLAVDHDHEHGHVRALLCGDCNKGIGNFREDVDRLRKAAAYLEHHAEKSRHQFAA